MKVTVFDITVLQYCTWNRDFPTTLEQWEQIRTINIKVEWTLTAINLLDFLKLNVYIYALQSLEIIFSIFLHSKYLIFALRILFELLAIFIDFKNDLNF